MSNDFSHLQTDAPTYKNCRDQFIAHLTNKPNLLKALRDVFDTIFPGCNKGGDWYINYLFKFYKEGKKSDSKVPVQRAFIEALNADSNRSSLFRRNTLI